MWPAWISQMVVAEALLVTLDPPSSLVKAGDVVLVKYRVERTLGEGGMGRVVAIRHTELDELFAMKLMKPEVAAHPGGVERFLREARAAAKLQSDHVARVYDVGRLDDGTPYMLMEHLSGCDLQTLLATHGRFSASEVAAFLLQALDAVTEAHALGIIHRDLKPENLFVARRKNGTTTVKVLDFGISKLVRPDAPSASQTSSLVGSPYYMSPEQMRSAKDLDHRTDIWALGVIAYELLTDRVPFPGDSITEVCAKVLDGDPAPLRELAPGVSDEMVHVVSRCLQRRREDRFDSADELAAALQRIAREAGATPRATLPSIPMGAPRSSPSSRTSQSFAAIKLKRISNPGRTTASAVALPIDTAARAVSASDLGEGAASSRSTPTPSSLQATSQATSDPPPPTRRRASKRTAALIVAAGVAAAALAGFFVVRRDGSGPRAAAPPHAATIETVAAARVDVEASNGRTSSPNAPSLVDSTPGAAPVLSASASAAVSAPSSFNASRSPLTFGEPRPMPVASGARSAPPAVEAAPAKTTIPAPVASPTARHEGIY